MNCNTKISFFFYIKTEHTSKTFYIPTNHNPVRWHRWFMRILHFYQKLKLKKCNVTHHGKSRRLKNQNHHLSRNCKHKRKTIFSLKRTSRSEANALFSPQKAEVVTYVTLLHLQNFASAFSELGVTQGGTGKTSSSVKMLSAAKFTWCVYFIWFMSVIFVTIAWGPGCQRVEAFSRHRIQLENKFPAEIRLTQNLTTFTESHKTHVWQNFSIVANKI